MLIRIMAIILVIMVVPIIAIFITTQQLKLLGSFISFHRSSVCRISSWASASSSASETWVVPQKRGEPEYRPQNTIILISIGTPQG